MHAVVWDAPPLMLQTLGELAEFSVTFSQMAVVSHCVLGELFRLGHWPGMTKELQDHTHQTCIFPRKKFQSQSRVISLPAD